MPSRSLLRTRDASGGFCIQHTAHPRCQCRPPASARPDDEPPHPAEHKLLSRTVADWLAERIISGEEAPGARLTETKLAERAGVSRSPVREALRILQSEGLVEIVPRHGALVAHIGIADVEELYACRMLLEPRCDPARGRGAEPGDVVTSSTCTAERMERAVAADDPRRFLGENIAYFRSLRLHCPNETLRELVELTWKKAVRYWSIFARLPQLRPRLARAAPRAARGGARGRRRRSRARRPADPRARARRRSSTHSSTGERLRRRRRRRDRRHGRRAARARRARGALLRRRSRARRRDQRRRAADRGAGRGSSPSRRAAVSPDELPDELGAVLLAVKSQHTADALAAIAPRLARRRLRRLAPERRQRAADRVERSASERTVGAFVNFGADYLEPGRIFLGGRGALYVGELDGRRSERVEQLAARPAGGEGDRATSSASCGRRRRTARCCSRPPSPTSRSPTRSPSRATDPSSCGSRGRCSPPRRCRSSRSTASTPDDLDGSVERLVEFNRRSAKTHSGHLPRPGGAQAADREGDPRRHRRAAAAAHARADHRDRGGPAHVRGREPRAARRLRSASEERAPALNARDHRAAAGRARRGRPAARRRRSRSRTTSTSRAS